MQYFFRNRKRAFALISRYSDPDPELLMQLHKTLYVAQYKGKQSLEIIGVYSIKLVVGMVPFMLSEQEEACDETCARFTNYYFVAENPLMLFSIADEAERNEVDSEIEDNDDELGDNDTDEMDDSGLDDESGDSGDDEDTLADALDDLDLNDDGGGEDNDDGPAGDGLEELDDEEE